MLNIVLLIILLALSYYIAFIAGRIVEHRCNSLRYRESMVRVVTSEGVVCVDHGKIKPIKVDKNIKKG